jgi:transposase
MSRRKQVVVIEQILEMRSRGNKIRAIARCLKVSRNTVKGILRENESGQGFAIDRDPVAPQSALGGSSAEWALKLDWEKIRTEHLRGATFKVLHQEHCEPKTTYWSFWHEFRKRNQRVPTVSMRLNHKPGERTFFDFAEGIPIYDRQTGQATPTQFFCGVLPFSSYTYGEFVPSQKQPVLMTSIERAFHFFGGVTPYVTVDNLRAGVSKSHLYDPVINPGFVEFANHWKFAVLPARPYKPRDKAANESGIGVIQRSFFVEVRHRKFYSLAELNAVFRIYLERLNQEPMKDHGDVSRRDRFESEKNLLVPVASSGYEVCEWRISKVHADCHIQIEKKFYSVPFIFVGREVKVRLTTKLIEVFSEEREALATHARLSGKERVSTQEGHYPDKKVGIARFEVKNAKAQSERLGPKTQAVVSLLLDHEYPLKYLRRVQGILRLAQSGQVSTGALEYACAQALTFQKFHYHYIQSVAKFYQINGNRPVSAAPRREPGEVHLHRN